MMRRLDLGILLALVVGVGSCDSPLATRPIETGFSFTNFSRSAYAALAIRATAGPGEDAGAFFQTALLAPGASTRERFLDAMDTACPAALDVRLFLYERVNRDVPVGLDPGEAVESMPVVGGTLLDVPACAVQPLETYTIVNWDAPVGEARVKFAQATPVDDAIRASGVLDNPEAVWVVDGVDPALAGAAPPPLAASDALAGRVIDLDGSGLANVGVLLRARFRVRAGDGDPTNDPDAGFGDPLDVTFTDAAGSFRFARPAGAYRIEVFADDLVFRPASIDVETPQGALVFVAEVGP